LKIGDILERMASVESDAQAARRQMEQVLGSSGFARNERLSRLLRFVVERHLEGRDDELKESILGIEIFGRQPEYDPKRDPVVRKEASKLRARLNEYYLSEGKDDALVIELPKGGYVPLFRAPDRPTAPLRPPFGTPVWIVTAIGFLAVGLAAFGWWRIHENSAPIAIAVLPLENLNRSAADDYFADGLTGELIRNLSIIDGLAVRSQTSSFAFKGKPRDVREAGNQLGADYVLEGSVLRAGQQLRINVQLVRVRDDLTLWSGRYDRELTDVLAIQDDISRGIVNRLRLKLGRGRRRYETSVEAYDLYLRARALPLQHGPPGYTESIGLLEEAIARDRAFAPAYAGLATAYALRSGQPTFEPATEMPKMKAAAEKAIQLDPLSAEAHEAMAIVYARDARWKQSEQTFRRAIELEPNRTTAYGNFAMFLLLPLGRIEEALRQAQLAEKTDPFSPEIQFFLVYILNRAGRQDESAGHCRKLTADFFVSSAECLAGVRLLQGRADETIQILEPIVRRGVSPHAGTGHTLGCAYARAGRRSDAETMAASSSDPLSRAIIFTCLGDKDRAFQALGRAAAAGPVRMGQALSRPALAPLRGDPRLKALRKRVGLPE
jgi:serine/threonine-protein kinase